ncbi:unnamed protein product [Ixodes pacificus]
MKTTMVSNRFVLQDVRRMQADRPKRKQPSCKMDHHFPLGHPDRQATIKRNGEMQALAPALSSRICQAQHGAPLLLAHQCQQ